MKDQSEARIFKNRPQLFLLDVNMNMEDAGNEENDTQETIVRLFPPKDTDEEDALLSLLQYQVRFGWPDRSKDFQKCQ